MKNSQAINKVKQIEKKAWTYLYETGNGYSSKKLNGVVMERLRNHWELLMYQLRGETYDNRVTDEWRKYCKENNLNEWYTFGDTLA